MTKEELGDSVLFPHIISKNVSFKVNFGQLENNLLHDLKAKPKKKKVVAVPEPVAVAEPAVEEPAKATAGDESAPAEEAKKVEEEDEAKAEDGEAPETVATSVNEEEEAKSVAMEESVATEAETPVAAEEVAEEKKEEETSVEGDVEMTEEKEEEKKPEEAAEQVVEEVEKKEEQNEEKTTETKPAEEVKEVVVEPEEEEEPLPEINRENLPGYIFIGLVDKEQLVAGPLRPESRKECEVIMMIGLSGAGKTKWVKEWIAEHPEKRYIVLGATALIDRMKVSLHCFC